ncbi:hypothetical protein [Halomonas sp. DP3Y7-1]|uniref:hypothetical protein n=1 Tax=Halomonas sp. DP3Y7-1 TaxID=2859082 RepID=UPI001C941467|nr:hypothetical protein [Halomonas sp. DP3Y7-1]MBY6209712.1 hypothetical protein [Halomonas sp. DP3Y7-2]MBY6229931.1 hypothetical protein [Halomonas sp. DP3Y7-1]
MIELDSLPPDIDSDWECIHTSKISSSCIRICLASPNDPTHEEQLDLDLGTSERAEQYASSEKRRRWRTFSDIEDSGVLGIAKLFETVKKI